MRDKRVDLHIHTIASDGTWNEDELIEKIKIKGIDIFAVTDHDSFGSIQRVKELASNEKIDFIPGIEVSTKYKNKLYHVLGYGIEYGNKDLVKLIEKNKKEFERVNKEEIEYLENIFEGISFEEFLEYEHINKYGGWKSYSYCVDKGICKELKGYFELFKGSGRGAPSSGAKLANSKEAIDAIKASNGIAILAHPGARFCSQDIGWVLETFLNFGIDGFECYHTENSDYVVNRCLEFCKKNDLQITGGSDCHGDFMTRNIGIPDIKVSEIRFEFGKYA